MEFSQSNGKVKADVILFQNDLKPWRKSVIDIYFRSLLDFPFLAAAIACNPHRNSCTFLARNQ
jgi:hypothetical protein